MQPSTPTTVLINAWFNSFPIRILGTLEDPVFYASEIGNILGSTQVSDAIRQFGEPEIVSSEQLAARGIQPTAVTKTGRIVFSPRSVMLTEAGVSRLIAASCGEQAGPLHRCIYAVLVRARRREADLLAMHGGWIDAGARAQSLAFRTFAGERYGREVWARNPADATRPGYVYFIITSNHALDDAVGVGCTSDPQGRVLALQAGNQYALTLYRCVQTADKHGLEARFHAHLAPKRIHGEWFKLSLGEIDQAIAAVVPYAAQ